MKISIFVAALLTFFQMGFSATPADTFKLANEAFDSGAVADAIQLYESIVSSRYKSAALYHNLGAAYLSTEQWPEARYYTEKAIAENPLDSKIQTNLAYIKTSVGDPYPFPAFPLSGTIDVIHSVAGHSTLSIILLVVFLATLAMLWLRPTKWKLISYSLAGMWIVFFCLFLIELHESNTLKSMGIVWEEKVELLEKPDELSTALSPLNEGQKVRVLEYVGPWCRVDLADGSTGWIELQKIRMIL